jgi:hypothetical protein
MVINEDKTWRSGRMLAAALTVLLIVSAAGCASAATATPAKTPGASPSSTPPTSIPTVAPVFVSDQAAFDAAEAAYRGYIEMADLIITEGGARPERIEQYTTGPLAAAEYDYYESLKQKGWRGTGKSTFYNMTLRGVDENGAGGRAVVIVTVCSDVTNTDMVDASGQPVPTGDFDPTIPYRVVFDLADSSGSSLKAADTRLAESQGVCP